jgi:chromate transport protein ChrA
VVGGERVEAQKRFLRAFAVGLVLVTIVPAVLAICSVRWVLDYHGRGLLLGTLVSVAGPVAFGVALSVEAWQLWRTQQKLGWPDRPRLRWRQIFDSPD